MDIRDPAGGESAQTSVDRAFLICDIRGYSTFTTERGDAAAAELAVTFANLARDAVVARNGRVLGLRGDEVVAVFESGSQAVRAALELQSACGEQTAAIPAFALPVGVGIDSGDVVPVGDDYRGAVINKAARLCSRALSGQVLVTRAVADGAAGSSDLGFDQSGTADLKGFDQPVETFEARSTRELVVDLSDAPSGERPPAPELDLSGELADRDAELSWLRGTWRQARRGNGRVVFLSGPPGIGKSRLAAELAHHAATSGDTVRYAGGGGAAGAETVVAIRGARSAGQPGLWIIDDLDLHPEAIGALADAIDAIESRPALVLALCRTPESDAALAAIVERVDERGDGHRHLRPIDLDAVRTIARSYVADVGDVPAESILRSSAGVPSRVHELVSDWAADETQRQLEAAASWLAEGRAKQASSLEFADNLIATKLARIYDAARGEDLGDVCPYKGLASFEERDAPFFFGRERLVGELAARTVGSGLLTVAGPSGSGKSSAVLGGLVPSLAAGLLPGSERWVYRVIRPGDHPRATLEAALGDAASPERLMLVVDQFEELFTSVEDASERSEFIARIVQLAGDPSVVVVVTLRADFTGHVAPYPELAELLASNLVLVGPMTAEELSRAAVAPARRVGLRVETALVDALVSEVYAEPGALPLFSTALVELWRAREGGWLRLAAYERTGGVRTAVARLAESSYAQLSETERNAARAVLLRLVGPDDGEGAVRRRVNVAEFDPESDPVVSAVLARLTRDRLLTRDGDNVEIAHEALVREWPRLAGWLTEDAAGRQVQSQLRQAAGQWAERGRDSSDLYRGPRLAAALDWSQTDPRRMNVLESEFLDESRRASERDVEKQRRTNRRLRSLLAGAAVFLIAALVAGILAFVQRNDAKSSQRVAQAQALRSDAERIGTVALSQPNLDLSMLLAVAGVKLENLPETRSDLLVALQHSPAAVRVIRPSQSQITAVAYSPDGRLLATGDLTGAVRFEDLATWTASGGVIQLQGDVAGRALHFSPDGRSVAVATGAGNHSNLYLIDVATRRVRLVESWPGLVPAPPEAYIAVAFSPDGKRLAVGLSTQPPDSPTPAPPVAETLLVVDAATGNTLWQRNYPVQSGQWELEVGFTPAGTLVTSAEQGTTDLWDPTSGTVIRQFPSGGRFALSPDGQSAAVALNSPSPATPTTSMEVLDLRSGTTRTLQGVSAPTWITSLTFTPDGKSVVGGSFDGDVRVWEVASGSIVHTFVTQTNSFIQVGVDPTGRTVLAGADDGSVVAWDLSGQQGLGQSFAWADPGLTCPAPECFVVNPSSTLMANDLADGTIALVDLRTLKPRGTLPGVGGKVANGLAFLGDDQTLIGGDMGGTITFWDTNSLTARRTLHVPDGVVWLATSPDQKALAVQSQAAGAATSEVRLLDLASGEVTRTYSIASGGAGVIFSPDGRLLAALGCCSAGSAVHVWDARSGAELYHPKLAGQTSSIAFSPTSAVLAGGTADGKLVLWDAHTGTQLGPPIQVSAASVVQISFSPDGHLIAAGSGDGSSILIDASSREQVGNSFPVLQQAVPAPQFEPDGDLLIVYLTNAGRYPTDLQAWERFACQVAGRDLTPAEWSSFLPNRPYQHVCPG